MKKYIAILLLLPSMVQSECNNYFKTPQAVEQEAQLARLPFSLTVGAASVATNAVASTAISQSFNAFMLATGAKKWVEVQELEAQLQAQIDSSETIEEAEKAKLKAVLKAKLANARSLKDLTRINHDVSAKYGTHQVVFDSTGRVVQQVYIGKQRADVLYRQATGHQRGLGGGLPGVVPVNGDE